jgi:uncharacterized repeat protein (TIGR04042 family)
MPEVVLQLHWPDGLDSTLYSPSTVVLDYLPPGKSFSVAEVERLGLQALHEASERVRARYGFACTRTDEEASKLRQQVARYGSDASVQVSRSGH